MTDKDLIVLVTVMALILILVGVGTCTTRSTADVKPPDDRIAWITPDGMLYIQVERGSELLYFDSFNIAGLHRVAQSPNLQWANRWEFRRE